MRTFPSIFNFFTKSTTIKVTVLPDADEAEEPRSISFFEEEEDDDDWDDDDDDDDD